MGRGSENLLLARASRPSAVGALRRVPCLADYTGGRLSFGNERSAPLVFPRADRAMPGRRGRRGSDLRPAFLRARPPSFRRGSFLSCCDPHLHLPCLLVKLSSLSSSISLPLPPFPFSLFSLFFL